MHNIDYTVPPPRPTNVTVLGIQPEGLILGWTEPRMQRFQGYPVITHYVTLVFKQESNITSVVAVSPNNFTANFILSGLTPNTTYTLRLMAVSELRNGSRMYGLLSHPIAATTGLQGTL